MNAPADPAPSDPLRADAFGTHVDASRYLTSDLPGIGGVIKQRPEDFFVEELPLYQPAGEGEHIYLFIEKRSMASVDMLNIVARHFGVPRGAVGHAGLKDKQAVTTQVVSVHTPGKKPEDFPMLRHPNLTVLWSDLHTNKLRRGHLAGNRFSIRVRGVVPTQVLVAKKALDRLAAIGVPNRIGVQRFGAIQNNHLIGRALVRGDYAAAVDLLLSPHPLAPPVQAQARALFAEGRLREAADRWPRQFKNERRVLEFLAVGKPAEKAFFAIDPTAAGFYISSFQSAVFNDVLNRRVLDGTLGELLPGDRAFIHKRRTTFLIDEHNAAEPDLRDRLARFDISPSGPMWGPRMQRASARIDDAELAALAAAGLTPADLDHADLRRFDTSDGDRRPLRIPLTNPDVEAGTDEHGPFIRCAFELPRGSFATTVMDEIMKVGPAEAAKAAERDEDADADR
jgi:tRNA pseudouridine13 synthase